MGSNQYLFLKGLFVILVLGLGLLGCQYNPEERVLDNVDIEESINIEREVGSRADLYLKKIYPMYPETSIQNYINTIGKKIVSILENKHFDYRFTVLDTPKINAFSLPGGFVYITRGLLAHLNSESELAFVLSHEIAHINARQGAQLISQNKYSARLLDSISLTEDSKIWRKVVKAAVNLTLLGYGREAELEADRLGVQYMAKAGYDPKKVQRYFSMLQSESEHEKTWADHLLAAHPDINERIAHINKAIKERPFQTIDNNEEIDPDRQVYLSHIQGIVYGENTLLGRLEEGWYVNPALGIEFEVHPKWILTLDGTKNMILRITDKDQLFTAYLELFLRPLETGVSAFGKQFPIRGDRKILKQSINYFDSPAYQDVYTKLADGDRNDYKINTYFLHHHYGLRAVFRLKNYFYESNRAMVNQFFRSIYFMDVTEQLALKSAQLTLYTWAEGDTLTGLSQKIFNSEAYVNHIRTFNGLHASESLKVGSYLKIPPPIPIEE